jgi:hypothetical protein
MRRVNVVSSVLPWGCAIRGPRQIVLPFRSRKPAANRHQLGIFDADFQISTRIFLMQQRIATNMCAYCNISRKDRSSGANMTILELLLFQGKVPLRLQNERFDYFPFRGLLVEVHGRIDRGMGKQGPFHSRQKGWAHEVK